MLLARASLKTLDHLTGETPALTKFNGSLRMLPAAGWKRAEVFPGEVTRGRVGPNPGLRERRLLLIDNLFEGLALPAQAV